MTVLLLILLATATWAQPATPMPASFDLKDDLIDFHYGWSAEVAAVPELARQLTAKKDKQLTELKAGADEERRERNREKYGLTFTGFQRSTQYDTAGQSPRLLSLSAKFSGYGGGAHGYYGTTALLWDRQQVQPIDIAHLFDRVGEFILLRPAMCAMLDKHRLDRRGGPNKDTGFRSLNDAFNGCPKYEDLSIWIADRDKDARFDTVSFAADPYVAGPFSEGSYVMELPVTERLIAALKSDYRDSFEAGQRQ